MDEKPMRPGRGQTGQIGQSITELTVGVIIIIPIILLAIDVGTLFLGVSVNQSACRDAARAAASGSPGQLVAGSRPCVPGSPPYDRALAVIRKGRKAEGAVRLSDQIVVNETVRDPVPQKPFGGPVAGEVTVESTVHVVPPFIVGAIVGQGGMEFRSRQTFPYTYQMPGSSPSEDATGSGAGAN